MNNNPAVAVGGPVASEEPSVFTNLPAPLVVFFLAGALLGLTTVNPWLTAAAILTLPVFIGLLWRPGEPPVLLFAVTYQWLQVTAKLFQANVQGLPVAALAETETVVTVISLSLAGLVVLAGGMRLGLRRLPTVTTGKLSVELQKISVERAFVLYLAATAGSSALLGLAWSVPGLTQPIISLAGLRWAFFFLLGYVVLKKKKGYAYFLIAFGIEFITGIGFFSGFKTVIFVSLLVAFATFGRIDVRTLSWATVGAVLLFLLGSAWTVVKSEYRTFVNEGTGMQVVNVSRADQVNKLVSLVGGLSREDLAEGSEPLFARLSYVDYFGYAMEYVPEVVPHEGGELWKASLQHILQPRMLFPSKPRLPSDSELTMRYTGLHLASGAQGTSISIGYMGESYIDFGRYGMFIPIFIIGILWGLLYRYFLKHARFTSLGYGIAMSVLLGAYLFEVPSIKLLGGMLMSFLIAALFLKYAERPVWRWLSSGSTLQQVSPMAPRPQPTHATG
jgi:nitrogen fixation protein